MHRAGSQNLSLDLPSVLGRKSMKLIWKMKDSGGLGGYAPRGAANFELRVDLSMGRKTIEIP